MKKKDFLENIFADKGLFCSGCYMLLINMLFLVLINTRFQPLINTHTKKDYRQIVKDIKSFSVNLHNIFIC